MVLSLSMFLLAAAPDGGPAVAADGGAAAVAAQAPMPRLQKNPLSRQVDEARVERVLASLDARGRAAQLLLAYPQRGGGPVEVGGVLFVGGLLSDTAKAKERLGGLYARARVPPFVAVDMEGGPSNRMKRYPGLKDLPPAKEMAALDDAAVRAWGKKVGEAMKAVGLNVNLAPVLDVAETGHMADCGRSYGGDGAVVARKARAYSEGLLSVGVVPIGKHFPGYGNLAGDSDHALASAAWDKGTVLEQVKVFDLAKDVLGGVMMSNVVYTAYGTRPAILAPSLVALAHERDWLTITDDIAIKALSDGIDGTEEDVLREALLAGNDLLLTTAPPDWDRGIDYIGLLTRFGEEDPAAKAKIDAACRRLLRLKDRMGLLEGL